MAPVPVTGPVRDDQLGIIRHGGILVEDHVIQATGSFDTLAKNGADYIEEIPQPHVLLPGFVDSHTHICYAGSRAGDYTARIAGATYQEILKKGGGIYDTVKHTRNAGSAVLTNLTEKRIRRHFEDGITTVEIKSGYGLSTASELKMLKIIQKLAEKLEPDVVATCLAAHTLSPDFTSSKEYLDHIIQELLPQILLDNLATRVDIFIEENAFTPEEGYQYLSKANKMGFRLTVHADQFTSGGSEIAARLKADSADHLEIISDEDIRKLVDNGIVATVLPGSSLGLGLPFAPARKILDAGGCLAIASDWNPGSAPMGDLLTQAALLSAYQKLSFAETLAGITCRAATALKISDRGILDKGKRADFVAFDTDDYRDILYHQGRLKPSLIWKNGKRKSKYTGS